MNNVTREPVGAPDNPNLQPVIGALPARTHIASTDDLMPALVAPIATIKARLEELQQFITDIMVEGTDYGRIEGLPDTAPKSLLQPGAQKLLEAYGYEAEFVILPTTVEQWRPSPDFPHGFWAYNVMAVGYSKRSGNVVGTGMGSCNSLETKYRWRTGERKCPKCNAEKVLIAGKPEWGKGEFKGKKHWLCYTNKGGCGECFAWNDRAIVEQKVGRVENTELADRANTYLKMACKRALVALALLVTRSSGLLEPEPDDDDDLGGKPKTGDAKTGEKQGDTKTADGSVEVMWRGQRITTKGVTAATFMRLATLGEEYDKLTKAGEHLAALRTMTGKDILSELTEEEAQGFLTPLQSAIEQKRSAARGEPPDSKKTNPFELQP